MPNDSIRTTVQLKSSVNLRARLMGRLKAISVISLPESDFAKYVQDLESDPLFKKFFLSGRSLPRVIRRDPWPTTRLHQGFYELKEEIAADSRSVDIVSLLENHQGLIKVIRRIGQEAFERFFLFGDNVQSMEEIAERTELTLEEVKKIYDLVLELSVKSEFIRVEPQLLSNQLHYTLIAQIELDRSNLGGLYFAVTSPHLARGRYSVDKEALLEWEKKKILNPDEKKHVRALMEKIELANIRQNTLLRILEEASASQITYLSTQEKSKMKPMTMRSLAKQLKLSPSTISRAVSGRSVKLPWDEEVPLARLLPNTHDVLGYVLEEIMGSDGYKKISDAELSRRISSEYDLSFSRRTVNECRREIEAQDNS